MLRTLVTAAPLVLSAVPAAGPLGEEGLQPGNLLPDVELPTVERDRVVRLASLRGKRLLLIQFASW